MKRNFIKQYNKLKKIKEVDEIVEYDDKIIIFDNFTTEKEPDLDKMHEFEEKVEKIIGVSPYPDIKNEWFIMKNKLFDFDIDLIKEDILEFCKSEYVDDEFNSYCLEDFQKDKEKILFIQVNIGEGIEMKIGSIEEYWEWDNDIDKYCKNWSFENE